MNGTVCLSGKHVCRWQKNNVLRLDASSCDIIFTHYTIHLKQIDLCTFELNKSPPFNTLTDIK